MAFTYSGLNNYLLNSKYCSAKIINYTVERKSSHNLSNELASPCLIYVGIN
jgi:hypothetical protein